MLRIAFPMLASSLSWGLSIVAHSVIIGHMGTDATAAYSVTNVATSLIQCLSQGFANGAGVMLGTLLGQNLFEKAKEDVALYTNSAVARMDSLVVKNEFLNELLLYLISREK